MRNEKIFPSDIPDKGLICNVYKQLTQVNIKKKKRQPDLKMGRKSKRHFPKQKCRGQQGREQMLKTANFQGNVNQNHSAISPYSYQSGCYQKEHR